MHLPKTPINYFSGDPWTIVEEGFDPAYQRVSESVFSVANEFMGVRGLPNTSSHPAHTRYRSEGHWQSRPFNRHMLPEAGLGNTEFIVTSVENVLSVGRDFDFIYGRCILMQLPNPFEVLERI